MSALLILVKANDKNNIEEVHLEAAQTTYTRNYSDSLGGTAGFDGDLGGMYLSTYVLINVGNTTAKNVIINKQSTNPELFRLQYENNVTKAVPLQLPNIEPEKCCAFRLITNVPKNSGIMSGTVTLTVEYMCDPGDLDLENSHIESEISEQPDIEVCTHIEELDLHGGRPYGSGAYNGQTVYGQEGLYKVTKSITTLIPIGGIKETVLMLSFFTKQRYKGNELTIEEIQSSSTSAYMNLDCFDGPMLPLYLGYSPNEDI